MNAGGTAEEVVAGRGWGILLPFVRNNIRRSLQNIDKTEHEVQDSFKNITLKLSRRLGKKRQMVKIREGDEKDENNLY